MATNLLNETKVRNAKPREKPYRLSDGGGLCLLVTPADTRLWRLRYRQPGKVRVDKDKTNRGRPESMVSLGSYPTISLKDARAKAAEYRTLFMRDRITPAEAKRTEQAQYNNTFKEVALEWLAKQHFSKKTLEKADWTFKK
ncbi:MAG TPA: Arm DNA-binding domain-containing protein, partial [Steroidobacteraceae bacterium]|nr:Arm DNA-binding domain-containing protein [Steroidobacteraceae bacterium]